MPHYPGKYPSHYAAKKAPQGAGYAPKPRIQISAATHPAEAAYVTAQGTTPTGYRPGFMGDLARAAIDGQGWTQGQLDALRKAMQRDAGKAAQAPAQAAPQAIAAPAAMQGVLDLFKRAGAKLSRPALTIAFAGTGPVRLSVAGANAREPGTINVADDAPFGQGAYYGRIRLDGTFAPSAKAPPPPALLDGLRAFARCPADMAAAYGRQTGACCFCSRRLTDERSTAVGYGPTCAEKWGLPWGEAAATLACEAA